MTTAVWIILSIIAQLGICKMFSAWGYSKGRQEMGTELGSKLILLEKVNEQLKLEINIQEERADDLNEQLDQALHDFD